MLAYKQSVRPEQYMKEGWIPFVSRGKRRQADPEQRSIHDP